MNYGYLIYSENGSLITKNIKANAIQNSVAIFSLNIAIKSPTAFSRCVVRFRRPNDTIVEIECSSTTFNFENETYTDNAFTCEVNSALNISGVAHISIACFDENNTIVYTSVETQYRIEKSNYFHIDTQSSNIVVLGEQSSTPTEIANTYALNDNQYVLFSYEGVNYLLSQVMYNTTLKNQTIVNLTNYTTQARTYNISTGVADEWTSNAYYTIEDLDSLLENKVNKISEHKVIYCTDENGDDDFLEWTTEPTDSAVVVRGNGGEVYVPLSPVEDNEAVSKKYVDDEIENLDDTTKHFKYLGGVDIDTISYSELYALVEANSVYTCEYNGDSVLIYISGANANGISIILYTPADNEWRVIYIANDDTRSDTELLFNVVEATSYAFGGIKTGYTNIDTQYKAVQLDSDGKAYVYVPAGSIALATDTTLGGIYANSTTSDTSHTYSNNEVRIDSNGILQAKDMYRHYVEFRYTDSNNNIDNAFTIEFVNDKPTSTFNQTSTTVSLTDFTNFIKANAPVYEYTYIGAIHRDYYMQVSGYFMNHPVSSVKLYSVVLPLTEDIYFMRADEWHEMNVSSIPAGSLTAREIVLKL